MDKVDSKTASRPGPGPPNHGLSRTAGKKRGVSTPKPRSGIVTAVKIATNKTESPYRQAAGATRRKPRSDFDILLTPKVYVRRSSPSKPNDPALDTPLFFPPSKEAFENPATAWW